MTLFYFLYKELHKNVFSQNKKCSLIRYLIIVEKYIAVGKKKMSK